MPETEIRSPFSGPAAPLIPWWENRRVLVTGGAGNLGSHLVEWLVAAQARVTVADNLSSGRRQHLAAVADVVELRVGDLANPDFALACCQGQDVVIHAAGVASGLLAAGVDHDARFRANLAMGTVVFEASRRAKVPRLAFVSSSCVYAADAPVPTPESASIEGAPEEVNRGYALAKRALEALAGAQSRRCGQALAILRPFNLYGPRDLWGGPGGHVVPSMLERVLEPGNALLLWGDGSQRRSLMHARDAAWIIAWATAHHATGEPLNIGAPDEVTMTDLAHRLLALAGSRKTLVTDPVKPVGTTRKLADLGLLREKLGATARPETPLEVGLAEVLAARRSTAAESVPCVST